MARDAATSRWPAALPLKWGAVCKTYFVEEGFESDCQLPVPIVIAGVKSCRSKRRVEMCWRAIDRAHPASIWGGISSSPARRARC